MANAALKEALQALDTARFIGDTKRIAAAKAILAQLTAVQQIPETHPDAEAPWQLAAD